MPRDGFVTWLIGSRNRACGEMLDEIDRQDIASHIATARAAGAFIGGAEYFGTRTTPLTPRVRSRSRYTIACSSRWMFRTWRGWIRR